MKVIFLFSTPKKRKIHKKYPIQLNFFQTSVNFCIYTYFRNYHR